MKKQELFSISLNGNVLFDNLTEEEYFDKMEELAEQFYDTGSPHPLELRTEIKEK